MSIRLATRVPPDRAAAEIAAAATRSGIQVDVAFPTVRLRVVGARETSWGPVQYSGHPMFVGTIAPAGSGSELVGSFRWHWFEFAIITIWLVFVGTAALATCEELVTEVLAGRLAGGTLAGFVVLLVMLAGFGLLMAALTRFRRLDEKEIGILLRDALETSPTLRATNPPIGGSGRG